MARGNSERECRIRRTKDRDWEEEGIRHIRQRKRLCYVGFFNFGKGRSYAMLVSSPLAEEEATLCWLLHAWQRKRLRYVV